MRLEHIAFDVDFSFRSRQKQVEQNVSFIVSIAMKSGEEVSHRGQPVPGDVQRGRVHHPRRYALRIRGGVHGGFGRLGWTTGV